MKSRTSHRAGYANYVSVAIAAAVITASSAVPGKAYTFNTSPDWDVELDTNISYGLGVRADARDSRISNNPIQQNNEYKFPNSGNITSSRFDIASELSAEYMNDYGFDVSVAGWKDFAYNGGTQNNPGNFAPGFPYSALSSSPSGHYSSYTNNLYNLGGELDNAFAFANTNVEGIPVSIKVGRFTEYWGDAVFAGFQAISYGQSPIDLIKAVDAPGTQVKDLFMPRGQVSVHVQATPEITVGFQYDLEYRPNRFPEGGTFLGTADPVFIGPQSLAGSAPRSDDYVPPNLNGNFGVELLYAPDALNGTIGMYFRQFDDPTPYSPFEISLANGQKSYHLAYAQHVRLYGLSFDHNIGSLATAIEASVRTNTGLNSVPGGDPAIDPYGHDGARGNILNVVANTIAALTPTPLWQTGTAIAEVAWTHTLAVTHDKAVYDAVGYACAAGGINAGNGERDGCSTDNNVNLNVLFDPQWLQVFPGIDLDAPVSVEYGLYGNGQTFGTSGTGNNAGSVAYSVGIHALIRQKYNVKLDYSGYQSPTGKIAYNGLGQPYYSTGSGEYMWNDKAQVQLTLSYAF